MRTIALKNYLINKYYNKGNSEFSDLIAVEEPLQISLIHSDSDHEVLLNVTMRSPGDDFELVTGFLYNEEIISGLTDIEHIRYCNTVDEENKENKIKVTLAKNIIIQPEKLQRNFTSNSSCGVCGKQMLEQLCNAFDKIQFQDKISIETVLKLPEIVKKEQLLFKHTGGIHACGLFTSGGNLISVKEDIGRHNAFDKLIGHQLIKNEKFDNTIAVLSGRVGYEMIQKAAVAKIPVVVAVGAPTSLAVDMAKEAGICLIGFIKKNSLNIYCNKEYIAT